MSKKFDNIFDIELEYRLIQTIIKKPKLCTDILFKLQSKFFQQDGIRYFVEGYKSYIAKYEKPTTVQTVRDYCKNIFNDKKILTFIKLELKQVKKHKSYSKKELDFAISRLVELWSKRKFLGLSKEFSEQIIEGKGDNILDLLDSNINKLIQLREDAEQKKNELLVVNDSFEYIDKFVKTIHEDGDKYSVSLGLPSLDLKNKPKFGEMVNVMAKTGGGKSLYLCQIARQNMLLGKNVLIITVEMTKEMYLLRLLCGILDIDIELLTKGTIYNDENSEELKKWKRTKKHLSKVFDRHGNTLHILDVHDDATIQTVGHFLSQSKVKYNLVILDYAADLQGQQRDLSDFHWQNQAAVYKIFKNYCLKYNFVGITAQQAKTGKGEQGKVGADDGAGSKVAGDRSDMIFWITQTPDDLMAQKWRIYNVKDRNSKAGGTVFCRRNAKYMRFEELESDDDENEQYDDNEDGILEYLNKN